MLKHYLTVALRSFRRQKGYSALNVVGLAVGLAGAFFILLWVQDEIRYDHFHAGLDQLYVAKRNVTFTDGTVNTWDAMPRPASTALEDEFPEVEHAEMVSFENEVVLSRGDRSFREEGYWADPAFFEIFSFRLLAGDASTALEAPDGVVISERLATAFFGDDWSADTVLGQILRVDGRMDARITGVSAEVPAASTLKFDWILPSADYYARNEWTDSWTSSGMQLFVRLAPGTDLANTNDRIRGLINANAESDVTDLFLQPFGDQYLYGEFENGHQAGGRIEYVRIFGIAAFLLVLIACINFMNLATARAAQRAGEIGVRKSIGATRAELALQFIRTYARVIWIDGLRSCSTM